MCDCVYLIEIDTLTGLSTVGSVNAHIPTIDASEFSHQRSGLFTFPSICTSPWANQSIYSSQTSSEAGMIII